MPPLGVRPEIGNFFVPGGLTQARVNGGIVPRGLKAICPVPFCGTRRKFGTGPPWVVEPWDDTYSLKLPYFTFQCTCKVGRYLSKYIHADRIGTVGPRGDGSLERR